MSLKKYIISGNIIEVYSYDKYIKGRGNTKGENLKNSLTDEKTKQINYNKTQTRRRELIRRLACINFNNKYDKFLTLTYAENVQDLTYSHEEFKKFIKRLEYKIKRKIKYLAVIEFQDTYGRGAIHYHCLLDIPYIPQNELQEIWGLGIVHINAISHVDNLGAYLIKYMTKDSDDIRLRGKKGYLLSRNLKRPETILNHDLSDFYYKVDKLYKKYNLNDLKPVYTSEYLTDKLGFCEYKQYNIIRKEKEDE